jgi:hypothetical protein
MLGTATLAPVDVELNSDDIRSKFCRLDTQNPLTRTMTAIRKEDSKYCYYVLSSLIALLS